MPLRTDDLSPEYQLVAEMDYIFEKQKLFIVTSKKELIFLKKRPAMFNLPEDEPGGILVYQTEFPRAAAAWMVDVIENRLWRSTAEGGLPSGQNSVTETIAGEKLKIRRSMNVSGPGEKGFYFINLSRPSLHFETDDYQEIQITDKLLKDGGLMDVLKSIASEA